MNGNQPFRVFPWYTSRDWFWSTGTVCGNRTKLLNFWLERIKLVKYGIIQYLTCTQYISKTIMVLVKGADLVIARGGQTPLPSLPSEIWRSHQWESPPFCIILYIYFRPTKLKFFLKAPLAPIYANFKTVLKFGRINQKVGQIFENLPPWENPRSTADSWFLIQEKSNFYGMRLVGNPTAKYLFVFSRTYFQLK